MIVRTTERHSPEHSLDRLRILAPRFSRACRAARLRRNDVRPSTPLRFRAIDLDGRCSADSGALSRAALAHAWAVPRRTRSRGDRRSGAAERVLLRLGEWRGLEVDRCWPRVVARIRLATRRVHWRG